MNLDIKQIKKKSLAQEVAENLRSKIRGGAIKIGNKLPTEPELMKSYGVGRSTIREAVKHLEQSGFVKVQQGVGTLVISYNGNYIINNVIDESDFAEIFEVRQLLELKIVEKAALNRKDKDIKLMKHNLGKRLKYAEKGLLKECIEADIAFHVSIAESCGNEILSQLYKTLSVHLTNFFIRDYEDTANPLNVQHLHEELLSNIEKKEPQKAVKIAKSLIEII